MKVRFAMNSTVQEIDGNNNTKLLSYPVSDNPPGGEVTRLKSLKLRIDRNAILESSNKTLPWVIQLEREFTNMADQDTLVERLHAGKNGMGSPEFVPGVVHVIDETNNGQGLVQIFAALSFEQGFVQSTHVADDAGVPTQKATVVASGFSVKLGAKEPTKQTDVPGFAETPE